MAKLALLFVAVFCIFAIAAASRIPRDTESAGNDIAKQMEEAWKSMTKQVEGMLSKENMDKMAAELKEVGEKIKAVGADVMAKIEENTKQAS